MASLYLETIIQHNIIVSNATTMKILVKFLVSSINLLFSSQIAAAVPKISPYKKFIERKLMQFQEFGTTALISKRWEEGKPVCEEELNEGSLALGPGMG